VDDFYRFDQIQTAHRTWVGDKSYYLSLLAQQGCTVIPGMVISAKIFQRFLEQMQWIEPLFADLPNSSLFLDVDNSQQLQTIAQRIRQTIQSTAIPDSWLDEIESAIVDWQHQGWQTEGLMLRPSLALAKKLDPSLSARTTGLLESQVCWTSRDAIARSLKQVWAELFRAKSLLYWQRLDIQIRQVHLAVLVQPLGNAIASGDVRLFDQSLEIRAVWGLGKALVNGEVSHASYVVRQSPGTNQPPVYDAGEQTFAYRVIRTDGDQPLQSVPIEPAPIEPPPPFVADAGSPLTSNQLEQLVTLTRTAAMVLKMPMELEWTLLQSSPAAQPTIYLTQTIPQFKVSHPAHTPLGQSGQHCLSGLAAAPGQVTAIAWVVDPTTSLPTDLPAGVVLVTQTLSPDWLLHLKQIVGVIAEEGGMTSHAAIVAREMGIPAVLGVPGATRLILSGDAVRVDGDRGEIHRVNLATSEPASFSLTPDIPTHPNLPTPDLTSLPKPTLDLPVQPTQLWLTLSQPESIAPSSRLPVAGIGLLRSELMLLEALDRQHPQLWIEQGRQQELVDRIAQHILPFAEAFHPRPVFYRSLDLRSHEFSTLAGKEPTDRYPMLGMRGTLSYQRNPEQFEVELLALRQVQQSGYRNVRLLLPFVRTVEEFSFCRQQVEQAGLTECPDFQLWIMAEVPSVLLLLPDYVAAGVQGIAIGTNDLTQLMLGVDREHPDLAIAFNQQHPVMMRAIQQLITGARQAGIPCTLCGQAPSQHPEMIAVLVNWGITGISVSPGEVAAAQATIDQALIARSAAQSTPH
jgi:pyruvate, water dikinase